MCEVRHSPWRLTSMKNGSSVMDAQLARRHSRTAMLPLCYPMLHLWYPRATPTGIQQEAVPSYLLAKCCSAACQALLSAAVHGTRSSCARMYKPNNFNFQHMRYSLEHTSNTLPMAKQTCEGKPTKSYIIIEGNYQMIIHI